jgi:hypothetical protein
LALLGEVLNSSAVGREILSLLSRCRKFAFCPDVFDEKAVALHKRPIGALERKRAFESEKTFAFGISFVKYV